MLNASYRFNRDVLRQIDLSGQWPVAPGWYAVGRYNYSFRDSRLLEGVAGLEYNAGCWVLRMVFQRVQAAVNTTSTAFFVQLEFNGLGQIGSGDAAEFLKKRISDALGGKIVPDTAPATLTRARSSITELDS